jgi:vancomycin resistance protein YoaR
VRRIGVLLAWLLPIAAVVGVAGVAARDAVYWEKPLPGVAVRQIELDRAVAVEVDGKDVRLPSLAESLTVDRPATARAKVAAGHDSFRTRVRALADPSPPRIWVTPVLRPTRTEQLVARLERKLAPSRPARVERRGETFVAVPARPGAELDRAKLLRELKAAALAGRERLVAPLLPVENELTTAAAEDAAATAQRITGRPIALTFHGEDVATLTPRLLARLLRFRPAGDHFDLFFDRKRLVRAVQPALAPWRQRARNARFVVSGDGVSISPSRPGLDVNAAAVQEAVGNAAYGGRTAELSLKQTRADLTTAEARKLGIRRQISTFTTEMGTSSSNRIHNVHLMADFIDGTVIKPGDTFSFNESVGPRTAERGFLEGQMIVGSLLLPAIGGGVCQTATTLFNNAFELGLPILERHNHSFYISHYPLGRDATVSWGGPDFSFRNDLKTGILIKTSYTDSTLTFSFYGSDPHRRVVATTGDRVNWRSPKTTYALDPYAPRGSVRTVSGSNESGFDVTVTRSVYERGKLKRRDYFTSAYIAVGPTQIYGPGRSIPGPYFVLPRV